MERALSICAIVFALFVPALAHAQQVRAVADRSTIAVSEELYVEVEYTGTGRAQLTEPEGEDFVVVGTSTMTSMQIVNGRRTSRLTFNVTLRPSRTGQLTVGRFGLIVGGERLYTEPIAVTVTDEPQAAGPGGGDNMDPIRPTRPSEPTGATGPSSRQSVVEPMSDLMFRPSVGSVGRDEAFIIATTSEVSPTVGQEFVIDFVLLQPDSIFFGLDSVELTEPDFSDIWFQEITDVRGRSGFGRQRNVRVGNARYSTRVIRSYAAFALEGGELIIPSMEFVVADRGGRGRGRRSTLRSRPLVLDVQEPPLDGRPLGFHPGNVGSYEMTARTDSQVVRAGDTVNLTISVHGAGLLSRLNLPELAELDGARVFPGDDSHDQQVGSDGWMRGSARRRIAIVPLQEGTLQLPDVRFDFFNPWTGEYETRTHTLPPLTIAGQNPNLEAVTAEETAPELDWIEGLPAAREVSTEDSRGSAIGPVFFSALAAPPLFFAAIVLRSRAVRRREETSGDRRKAEAAGNARKALRAADPGEMGAAMRTYLEDVTDKAARGLRYKDVELRVSELATAEAGAVFAAALEAAETARFAGGDPKQLRDDAIAAIDAAEAGR